MWKAPRSIDPASLKIDRSFPEPLWPNEGPEIGLRGGCLHFSQELSFRGNQLEAWPLTARASLWFLCPRRTEVHFREDGDAHAWRDTCFNGQDRALKVRGLLPQGQERRRRSASSSTLRTAAMGKKTAASLLGCCNQVALAIPAN